MPVSSVFHDFLQGPWEQVRGYLVDELEQLQNYVQTLSNTLDTLTTANVNTRVLSTEFLGISGGDERDVIVPYTGTISGISLVADTIGDAIVDIWKVPIQSFPPTSAASIMGSSKPTLSSAAAMNFGTTGWKTSLSTNDILRFHIDSTSTISRLLITLVIAT